ncbi:MAG: GMC family oxidoreductase N-terminal domain-containing protein [Longimicrobiaceae bacterium]
MATAPAQLTEPLALLTPAERRALQAVCEALLPALAPEEEEGDDPRLFGLDAAALGVAEAMEQAIATLGARQQSQFRLLLRLLERPPMMGLLIRRASRFSALPQEERERALLAMATSRLPPLRAGFQGLKRLATFLFYSLLDESGGNPSWEAIGYTPSANPPAREPLLALTRITAPATLECDVCVIGSGAGGGVAAGELARAGMRVIVLEAGSGQQAPDFDQRELLGMQHLYLDKGLTATRDLGVTILAGGALGGGTTINWQTSLRTPDTVRDEWAELSGCAHFREESFTASLDAVTERLGVGTEASVVNANNAVIRRGCEALGYRWRVLPRNARGCDPEQCGYCIYGCRRGGKQSTAVTYLHDAQQFGDTTIIPDCHAERVLLANGRVTGVEAVATDPATGSRHRVRVHAPTVVVAAGALRSPALLLRSGLGLPALGRNLFLHPTAGVGGRYAERIEQWHGPPHSIMCDEFAGLTGNFGFRLEAAPAHPGMLALVLPWRGARDHRRKMQVVARLGSIIALTRDRVGGRVRVARDGQPLIDYRPGAQEREHLRRGIAAAVRVHLAAGAEEVLTLHSREYRLTRASAGSSAQVDAFCDSLLRCAVDRNRAALFSAHQMGTCRMGRDARSAVCDPEGEVFGVRGLFIADASAFPSSSGVNPMITVMALAHHTAQRIAAR